MSNLRRWSRASMSAICAESGTAGRWRRPSGESRSGPDRLEDLGSAAGCSSLELPRVPLPLTCRLQLAEVSRSSARARRRMRSSSLYRDNREQPVMCLPCSVWQHLVNLGKATFLFCCNVFRICLSLCWLDRICLDLGRLPFDLADCPLIYADYPLIYSDWP